MYKPFLPVLVFSFLSTSGFGQVTFMDSTYTWTEVEYYMIGYSSFKRTFASSPTTFNGKNYYEILSSPMEDGGEWQPTYVYLRYENQKLYQGYTGGDDLIFDYSLNVNDTFYPNDGPIYIISGIDSITLTNGEKRKRLQTECPQGCWGDTPIYWIEGLGSSAGLVQYHSICACDAGSEMLCISKNEELLYSNPDADSCWYLSVATSNPKSFNINIYPNPARDRLFISDPNTQIEMIQLFDMVGRKFYQGQESSIPLDHVPPGNYLVAMRLKDNRIITTLVLMQ